MESSGDKLFKFGTALVFGLVVFAAVVIVAGKEKKKAEEASEQIDVAEKLAELHRRASTGALALDRSEKLAMKLIQAGFPPNRPLPSLRPRGLLRGGGTAPLGKHVISVAHYAVDDTRLTLFLLPMFSEALPSSAATIVRQRSELKMARRGAVTVVFWKRGHWVTALATEAGDSTRDAVIDLVWAAERLL